MCVPRARIAIGVGIVLPLAAVLLELWLYPPTVPDGVHRVVGAVRRTRWDHRVAPSGYAAAAEAVAAERQPIVLTNSPAAHWPAIGRWRRDAYVQQQIPSMDDVIWRRDGGLIHRYWSSDAALAAVLQEPEDAMPRLDLPTATVLARIRRGERYYYSRRVTEVGESFPLGDIEPREWLAVDRRGGGGHRGSDANSTTWWVGGNGVCTGAHYDTSHNFFVQISGTKRFILSPPSAHGRYRLHPFLHPLGIFTTRAQHALAPAASSSSPSLPLVEGLSAQLNPGDAIYIPPLWFHTATAPEATPSLGINVWSASAEGELSGLEDAPPLPPALYDTNGEPLPRRRALLAAAYSALLEAVEGLRDAASRAQYVRERLWHGRYAHDGMDDHFEGLRRRCCAANCDDDDDDEEEVAGERGQVAFEAAPAVSAEELEALRRHARAVAEELSGGLPAAADVGVREITFLNMLEGLAAAALLPPESSEGHMCALLTFVQCFGRARGP